MKTAAKSHVKTASRAGRKPAGRYLPRAVIVTGRLDSISQHDRRFTLVMPDRRRVNGVFLDEAGFGRLAAFFGKPVTVGGKAHFSPAGRVRLLEATHAEKPRAADAEVFGKLPVPFAMPLDLKKLIRKQGPRSGVNAIIGKWPGQESDEEIRAALERLS